MIPYDARYGVAEIVVMKNILEKSLQAIKND